MKATVQFTLFQTPVGLCGLAWGPGGIVGLQLPMSSERVLRARMVERFPAAEEIGPPIGPKAQRVVDAVGKLLRGEAVDLSTIQLDFEQVPPFHRRVYEAARQISPGATIGYGVLAERVGSPGGARAVGQAMGRNPFPILVPCHRVLAAGGKLGGFTAEGGVDTKRRLLALEVLGPKDPAPHLDAKRALRALREADPALGELIAKVGPFTMEVERVRSVFSALARSIVYQQLNGRAAATIFGRVCDLFPAQAEGFTPAQLLSASDESLRGAGLSGAKLRALRDLAEKAQAKEIPTLVEAEGMADEALIEQLTRVRGIGRWTVEMFLMFRLGRPDILPLDDYGVRKGFARAFRMRKLPEKAQMERRGLKWRPYRSVASWYLWRTAELS